MAAIPRVPGHKLDSNGNACVTLGTTMSGEDQDLDRQWGGPKSGYTQITTATTQTIKSGSGVLYAVEVVTGGAGSSVTVYDNTAGSGTKLIDAAPTDVTRACYTPGPPGMAGDFETGLTVVTSGGTPAVINIWWI